MTMTKVPQVTPNQSISLQLKELQKDVKIPLEKYKLGRDVEHKILSGEYPTLKILQQIQQTEGEHPRDPSLTVVPPFAPRRTKSEIFKLEDFTNLDRYVSGVLPQPNEKWTVFANRLFAQCETNLEKVRAAFYFIGTVKVHLLKKITTTFVRKGPYEYVRVLRLGYENEVFEALMICADVPYHKIRGFKKGNSYSPGIACPIGGSWFVCYVEGEWRFVDPNWGSSSQTQDSEETVYACDDNFFLTDPTTFILTHCPTEQQIEWQLLARSLTVLEFNQFLYIEPEIMLLFDIELTNQPKNLVVMDETMVNIEINIRQKNSYNYTVNVFDTDENWFRTSPNKSVTVEVKFNEELPDEISIVIIPSEDGVFAIDIIVESEEENKKARYTTYMFHCVGVTVREERRKRLAEVMRTHPWNVVDIDGAVRGLRQLIVLDQMDEIMLANALHVSQLLKHREELNQETKIINEEHDNNLCRCVETEDLIEVIESEVTDMEMEEELQANLAAAKKALQFRKQFATKNQLLIELRNYPQPEHEIHKTIQAVLLLLGYYETQTRRWKRCQPLLKDLQKKLNSVNWDKLHPAIVARVEEILLTIDKRAMMEHASEAVVDIYDWAIHLTWCVRKRCAKNSFQPADLTLQKQILNIDPDYDYSLNKEDDSYLTSAKESLPYLYAKDPPNLGARRESKITVGRRPSMVPTQPRKPSVQLSLLPQTPMSRQNSVGQKRLSIIYNSNQPDPNENLTLTTPKISQKRNSIIGFQQRDLLYLSQKFNEAKENSTVSEKPEPTNQNNRQFESKIPIPKIVVLPPIDS